MLGDRPGLDLEHLLMGGLAAPASPDRPDLPVWEYRSYVFNHPEVGLEDLTRVRFPVPYFEGTAGVASIDEELKPFPRSCGGPARSSAYVVDAVAVVARYEMEHEAGLQVWDSDARGIVRLRPLEARRPILQVWVETLRPAAPPSA